MEFYKAIIEYKNYILNAFYLYVIYLVLIFIFVFLVLGSIPSNIQFFIMHFDNSFYYIYTTDSCQLTCRSLINNLVNIWFSFTRLGILFYCLYLYTFIILFYNALIYISKEAFSMYDCKNTTNMVILNIIKSGTLCNLIPGWYFWHHLGEALYFRYKRFFNTYFTLNMLTFYHEGKPLTWSVFNIKPENLEKTLDNSFIKHISLHPYSSNEKSIVLTKFFDNKPSLFKYKQAILSGDLSSQKTALHQMSPFEVDLALNSQNALWINFFNTKVYDQQHINDFSANPEIRNYFKLSICDLETMFYAKVKPKNCYFIHGKQIPGYSMYHNSSNLNNFHLSQEFALSQSQDFVLETPLLFKNRIKQTYGKLQEMNHACKVGIHDSLFVSPSERAIRTDSYVISSSNFNLDELTFIFEKDYTFQTRFSRSELAYITPNSKIICLDFTKGVQREHFNSEEDFLLFIKQILVDNKISPLLREPDLVTDQEYLIAADFIFLKSDVSKFKVEDAFSNINQSINNLKGDAKISVNITWSIIDDVWNL